MPNTTHTPVTPEYLDELEALHRAATPGEWYLDYDYSPFGDGLRIGVKGESTLPRVMDDGSAGGEYGATTTLENMKFIVASHDALPALIAEVRRLNAALAEQTACAEKAEEALNTGQRVLAAFKVMLNTSKRGAGREG